VHCKKKEGRTSFFLQKGKEREKGIAGYRHGVPRQVSRYRKREVRAEKGEKRGRGPFDKKIRDTSQQAALWDRSKKKGRKN